MTTLPYQYVVVRAVPRVDREEFVNVGVVLYCQQASFLRCAWAVDEARLAALAPGLPTAELRAALAVIDDVCAGREGGGRPRLGRDGARFGWLAAPRSTIVQPGPVHGGVCADPDAELSRLVDLLVR
ncbi:MAG: DUF3037 domain-containing protein [Austwickia sp.]|nr:DUF3037 domain-containing protein [Austwickia sp.]MCO5308116.1 DUF3037 domain-containing protein [Austwickia sp.]